MTHLRITHKFSNSQGQTMAEYGLVLGVISVGVVLAFTGLATACVDAIRNVLGYF